MVSRSKGLGGKKSSDPRGKGSSLKPYDVVKTKSRAWGVKIGGKR